MTQRLLRRALTVGIALTAALGAVTHAQDQLSAAKDLYAAAAYEDALAALARIEPTTADVGRQIDEYRVYCLYALGRTMEAESAAEALVRKQPLVELDDASPRIEAMFLTVRKRLLPSLIRAEYRTARSALDEKNFPKAEPHLLQARKMLTVAQQIGASDESLADLGVLVDGFIELGRSMPRPAPEPSPTPVRASVTPREAEPAPAIASTPAAPLIYTVGDEGVVPPVAIAQQLPSPPETLRAITRVKKPTGILDVLVDESGAVQEAVIRQSVNPVYDPLLLAASRGWKYRPATKDGTPVKFRKLILVSLSGE